jgi:hypothetical protein
MGGNMGNNFNITNLPELNSQMIKKSQAEVQKQANEEAIGRMNNGLGVVAGGKNHYGFDRPDTYLLRDNEGSLDDRFKESVGDSVNKIKEFGTQLGQDADSREQMQLADSYQQLKGMANDESWAQNMRNQQFGNIDRNAASNMANIQNTLAMRGGLGSGASERMMNSASRDSLYAKQNAGLNIDMQNDARQRQLLGQLGAAETGINQFNANNFTNQQNRRLDALRLAGATEQSVDSSNVGAMRGDIQNQNIAAHNIYGEDMRAWGAEKTADAQRAAANNNSCFVEGTKIEMEDGSCLAIEDIEIGDRVELGGQVSTLIKSLAIGFYLYKGVKVTGSHAVLENGQWKRISECKDAEFVSKPCVVYCLSNENHRIKIKDVTFADYEEVENHDEYTPAECIEKLNEELC